MKEMRNIKIKVDMYDDIKFKIIDTKPERDLIHYIWTRMLTLAGKVNLDGELYLSKNIPYSDETLAIEFNRDVMQVKLALKVFMELEMVTIDEDNVYKVKNFSKYQNGSKGRRIINKQEDRAEEKSEDNINSASSQKKDAQVSKDDLISNDISGDKGKQCDEFNEQIENTKKREVDNKLQSIKKNNIKRKTSQVEADSESKVVGLRNKSNSKGRKNKRINNNDIIEADDDKEGDFIEFYDGDIRPLGKNERVIMEFKV